MAALADSPQQIIRKGLMLKQGAVVKSWKERYFILYNDRLCYYDPSEYAAALATEERASAAAALSSPPLSSPPLPSPGLSSPALSSPPLSSPPLSSPPLSSARQRSSTTQNGDAASSKAKGCIMLCDIKAVTSLPSRGAFKISVAGASERDYLLVASNDSEKKLWMESTQRAMLAPSRIAQMMKTTLDLHKSKQLCTKEIECLRAWLVSGSEDSVAKASRMIAEAAAIPPDSRCSDAMESALTTFALADSEKEIIDVLQRLKKLAESEDTTDSFRDRLVSVATRQYADSTERLAEALEAQQQQQDKISGDIGASGVVNGGVGGAGGVQDGHRLLSVYGGVRHHAAKWTSTVQDMFSLLLHIIATRVQARTPPLTSSLPTQSTASGSVSTTAAPTSEPSGDTDAATVAMLELNRPSGGAGEMPDEDSRDRLAELREETIISDDYEVGAKIGEGAYSIVHRAIHRVTGEHVAVKIAKKASLSQPEAQRLVDEVLVMSQLDHIHIVRLHAFYEDKAAFYIVTELMTGGELFDRIVTRTAYSEREARDIVRTLAEALGYMHSLGIAHRDMKPENILLSSPDESKAIIKIADMGFAKKVTPEGLSTSCGTPSYVSPDVLLGKKYGPEVDMWSLGVITYILLCGYAPFAASNQTDLFRAIVAGRFYFDSPYWDKVSPDAKDLIKHLLVVDPKKRFSAEEILGHRWFQGTVSSTELSSALSSMRMFQSSRREVIKRGELKKIGYFVRSRKTRVFVLTSDTLEYYDPADISGSPSTGNAFLSFFGLSGSGEKASGSASGEKVVDPKSGPSLSAAAIAVGNAACLPSAQSGLGRPRGIIAIRNIRAVCAVDSSGKEMMLPPAALAVLSAKEDSDTGDDQPTAPPTKERSDSVVAAGEYWFKIHTIEGREYLFCAESETTRADWIRAISSTLQHGELVRKAAVAMAGERMAEAVALMKLAHEWNDMMGAKQVEEPAVDPETIRMASSRASSSNAAPQADSSPMRRVAFPGTVSSDSAGGGLRATTQIESKVTRCMAERRARRLRLMTPLGTSAATSVTSPASPATNSAPPPVTAVPETVSHPILEAPPAEPTPLPSDRPPVMRRHGTCGEPEEAELEVVK